MKGKNTLEEVNKKILINKPKDPWYKNKTQEYMDGYNQGYAEGNSNGLKVGYKQGHDRGKRDTQDRFRNGIWITITLMLILTIIFGLTIE